MLHIRWHVGACSDVTVTRRAPIADRLRYPAATIERVRELARGLTDAQIAQALNAQGLRSAKGHPFTPAIIQRIRFRYAVSAARQLRPDEIKAKQLADELGVSIHFVHYWIKQGEITAHQIDGCGPWWITINAQQLAALRDRIRNSGHFQNRHREPQL